MVVPIKANLADFCGGQRTHALHETNMARSLTLRARKQNKCLEASKPLKASEPVMGWLAEAAAS